MGKVKFWWWVLAAAVLLILFKYSDSLLGVIQLFLGTLAPLAIGAGIAYVLNILMVRLERIPVFSDASSPAARFKRPFGILGSIAIVVAVVALLVAIVIPQLKEAFRVIVAGIPGALDALEAWIVGMGIDTPQVMAAIDALNVDWRQIVEQATSLLGSGVGNVFSAAVAVVSTVGGFVLHLVIGLIVALYLLASKERLARQFRSLADAYIPEPHRGRLLRVVDTAHETFSTFFIGQFLEAIIIGVLCALGMTVLQFPYATMIGAVVGATALLPIVGAYIGAILGAFMILTVNPLQAVGFLLFIVVLQQLEGNLIYPRVVGSSVGLPGLWVLLAVTVGGGVGGVGGMLLAVPLAATAYKLLAKDVNRRLSLAPGSSSSKDAPAERPAGA